MSRQGVAKGLGLVGLMMAMYWIARAGSLEPPRPPSPTQRNLIFSTDLPLTINEPGSYLLAENISTSAGGITIAADFVTLDLMGFALAAAAGNAGQDGISVSPSSTGVEVRNGLVAHWPRDGVNLITADSSRVVNVRAISNGRHGIQIGPRGAVLDSEAHTNGEDGIRISTGTRVLDSSAEDNGLTGIRAVAQSYGNLISRCTAFRNGEHGISSTFGEITIRDCDTSYNVGDGILIGFDSLVRGNNCNANQGAGIRNTGNNCLIDSNHVFQNTVVGILASANTRVIRNSAALNGTNYMFPVGSPHVGPKESPATGMSPWANLE